MKITSLGHSAFYIVTDDGMRIVTDPYNAFVGYTMPKVTADVVTSSHSHPDHSNFRAVEGDYFLVRENKTYMPPHMTITSLLCAHDNRKGALRGLNIIYKIRANGITLVHMGDIGESFNVELINKLGDVDVLFIPVGGNFTIGPAEARDYIDAISPKIAVPMHYRLKHCNMDLLGPDKIMPHFADMDVFHTMELYPEAEFRPGKTRFCVIDNYYSY